MQLVNSLRRAAPGRVGRAPAPAVQLRASTSARAGAEPPSSAVTLADAEAVHEAWVSAGGAEEAAVAPAAPAAAGVETFETTSRDAYYTRRHELVLSQFPNALGVDDFISRVEIALAAHNFRGDNAIGARPAPGRVPIPWRGRVGGWRCPCRRAP